MRGFFAAKTQTAPTGRLAACGACGLSERCSSPKLPVGGTGGHPVLFVVGGPDVQDDERGRWLTGPAGRLLRSSLQAHGVELGACLHTGATICHSPKPVTAERVGHCLPNMLATLRECDPVVVVPMGQQALRAVVGQAWGKSEVGELSRWLGYAIPAQRGNRWIVPTWDPAEVEASDHPAMRLHHEHHLQRALQRAQRRPWRQVPDWRGDVQLEYSPTVAAAWLRDKVQRGGVVAFDYETTSLKPDYDHSRIVSCAVAWGTGPTPAETIAFPWHGDAVVAMSELLRSPLPKIAANMKFEDRWTRAILGHRVRRWVWDTMLAAHVDNQVKGVTGLKFQAFVRLGQPLWNEAVEPYFHSRPGEPNRVAEVPLADLLRYNGLDSLLEYRLAFRQMKAMGHDYTSITGGGETAA